MAQTTKNQTIIAGSKKYKKVFKKYWSNEMRKALFVGNAYEPKSVLFRTYKMVQKNKGR